MGFDVGVVPSNPDGWGPPDVPAIPQSLGGGASIPFAPFSRSDKLGRIAYWTHNPAGPSAFAAASRDSVFDFTSADDSLIARAEDSSFRLVDAKPPPPRAPPPPQKSTPTTSTDSLAPPTHRPAARRRMTVARGPLGRPSSGLLGCWRRRPALGFGAKVGIAIAIGLFYAIIWTTVSPTSSSQQISTELSVSRPRGVRNRQ